jgi:hypothetical protein
MVPVAEFESGAVCVQALWGSPTNVGARNPAGTVSVIVKLPGPNVTSTTSVSVIVNEHGTTGLVPVIVMGNPVSTGHLVG